LEEGIDSDIPLNPADNRNAIASCGLNSRQREPTATEDGVEVEVDGGCEGDPEKERKHAAEERAEEHEGRGSWVLKMLMNE
jgi:hypothetical protein